jgi:hypothetical protein
MVPGDNVLMIDQMRTAAQAISLAAGVVAFLVSVYSLVMFALVPALGFDRSATSAHTSLQVAAPAIASLLVVFVALVLAYLDSRAAIAVAVIVGLSVTGGLLSLVGVGSDAGVGNVWSALNRSGHERRVEYIGALIEVDGQRPDYDERIALDQAEFIIRRSLAGVVGDFSSPMRVTNE